MATDSTLQTWAEIGLAFLMAGGVIFGALKLIWNKGKSSQATENRISLLETVSKDNTEKIDKLSNALIEKEARSAQTHDQIKEEVHKVHLAVSRIEGLIEGLDKNGDSDDTK